jgi:hypothetical protein
MPKDVFTDPDDEKERGDKGPLERFQQQVKDSTDDSEVRMERDDAGAEVAVVTRADKKRERGTMREENERLRRENEETKTRLARLEGAFVARQASRDSTDEEDDGEAEFEERYSQLQKQHTDAYKALIGKGHNATQAEKDEYAKLSARIERQRIEMTAERLLERRSGEQSMRTTQEVMRAAIRNRHQDVYTKPAAVAYAEGEFRKLRAMGKPDSQETLDIAMHAARRAFGLTREPAPSDATRSRFAGPPRGQSTVREPGVVRMTAELRRMANAKYSHIKDEEKRYKMWANNEGRSLSEDKD